MQASIPEFATGHDSSPSPPPAAVGILSTYSSSLSSRPPTVASVRSLMDGCSFSPRQMHGSRVDTGAPQVDRQHTMLHAFHYINELCGEAGGLLGGLLVLPGSHRRPFHRNAIKLCTRSMPTAY